MNNQLPDNKTCLLCKHIHYMFITEYLNDGGFNYHHTQCSEKECICKKGIYNNLEYLEIKYEQSQLAH